MLVRAAENRTAVTKGGCAPGLGVNGALHCHHRATTVGARPAVCAGASGVVLIADGGAATRTGAVMPPWRRAASRKEDRARHRAGRLRRPCLAYNPDGQNLGPCRPTSRCRTVTPRCLSATVTSPRGPDRRLLVAPASGSRRTPRPAPPPHLPPPAPRRLPFPRRRPRHGKPCGRPALLSERPSSWPRWTRPAGGSWSRSAGSTIDRTPSRCAAGGPWCGRVDMRSCSGHRDGRRPLAG